MIVFHGNAVGNKPIELLEPFRHIRVLAQHSIPARRQIQGLFVLNSAVGAVVNKQVPLGVSLENLKEIFPDFLELAS